MTTVLRPVMFMLAIGFFLGGCASSGNEPQQTTDSMSSQEKSVDVAATDKTNNAKVSEMSSAGDPRKTSFKFYNKTGYKVSMYVKSPYGEWHGDLEPWGNTVWTPIPHDGTIWTWAYAYEGGTQKLYWEIAPTTVKPGIEWFTFNWKE